MKITIPGTLPTMNEIIDVCKKHWAKYYDMKTINTYVVKFAAKNLPHMKRINLTIHWYCKDKRQDKDNIMAGTKFILDGLKEAGVIENDGWKQIGDINNRFYVDKENPRIEVEVEEIA
ncbi:RusA family crossover junction endodeoxyribonuclease [Effusibacillus dendaii]|uniref:Endodeoxyribonuclease n=1 Tax=Effusibacillus dendaii TaxID=2743772 RepID=A0A7I8DEY3_9BACL|nr:RusA family crossover junction endodeoxyribonuclease [Effusibacillus dendaii]BCJ86471.1 endodeoxyribonuclease [Effusibacillus dendaii]